MLHDSLRFSSLKRQVSVGSLLAHFGLIDQFHLQAGMLRGPCPLHQGTRRDSFVIDPVRGHWYCFSRCQRGGDIVDLARLLSNSSFHQTARLLASLVHLSPPPPGGAPSREHSALSTPFVPFTRTLPLEPHAPFLIAKGIGPALARDFEVGLYRGRGFLEGCIGVRLHDPEGLPLGYLGRRLDQAQIEQLGKWKCPKGLHKGSLLYPWHRLGPRRHEHLVLVECPWGALRLSALGIPAVALLGSHPTPDQLTLLRSVKHLSILLDGDQAGRMGAVALNRALEQVSSVRILSLNEGLDPDDLTDAALVSLIAPATSA